MLASANYIRFSFYVGVYKLSICDYLQHFIAWKSPRNSSTKVVTSKMLHTSLKSIQKINKSYSQSLLSDATPRRRVVERGGLLHHPCVPRSPSSLAKAAASGRALHALCFINPTVGFFDHPYRIPDPSPAGHPLQCEYEQTFLTYVL